MGCRKGQVPAPSSLSPTPRVTTVNTVGWPVQSWEAASVWDPVAGDAPDRWGPAAAPRGWREPEQELPQAQEHEGGPAGCLGQAWGAPGRREGAGKATGRL